MIPPTRSKRVISIFVLVMFNVSIMASLRTLPLISELGYKMFFFFITVAILFLIPCALVSAELATGWTKSGGVYIWVREALGNRCGFLAIWMQCGHNITWYPAILSFVAATLAYIINPKLVDNKSYIQVSVLAIFWGMTLINYFGIKTSNIVSSIGVIVGTLIPGAFIIGLGITWIIMGNPIQISFSPSHLIPDFSHFSSVALIPGLFLSFAGLEVSTGYAGEVQNPKKNFPKAIMLAMGITFSLFMLGSFSIAIVIPREQISLVAGLMEALKIYLTNYGVSWALPLLAGCLVIGSLAEINSWIIGPIKALHTTATHGNLPPFAQHLNRHGMPTHLLVFQAIVVMIVSFVILYMPSTSAAYWVLTVISAQTYLIMYFLMFISAIRLRYTHPHIVRAYHIPCPHKGIWWISSIGALASLFALFIGYVPPHHLNIGDIFIYEATLIISLVVMIAIPLIMYQFRKPEWLYQK